MKEAEVRIWIPNRKESIVVLVKGVSPTELGEELEKDIKTFERYLKRIAKRIQNI